MGIQDGTYAARPGQARVYENDKGSLVLCVEVQIEGGPVLKSFHTLAKADGTLMTRTIDNLKAWSGWDGTDPFWFTDNDLTGIAVEVVIENQPGMSDPSRMFPSVKWVNPPGGGSGGMAESGDRRSILAKYGGKLRANAGGVPVGGKAEGCRPKAEGERAVTSGGAVGPAPVAAGLGALPCAPVHGVPETRRHSGAATTIALPAGSAQGVPPAPLAAPETRRPFGSAQGVSHSGAATAVPKISDMNTCWGLMCDLRQKMPKAQVEQEWFAAVGIIEGKDQADMTPDEWGRVEEFILAKYGNGAVPRPAALAPAAEPEPEDDLAF